MVLRMMVSKGEIWLANLNPSKRSNEMGKVRPIVIWQGDTLNHSDYPTVIVIPLSTQLIDDAEPIRMRIHRRDKLDRDSDVIVTQIRAIDKDRLIEKLGTLSSREVRKVRELFEEIVS